MMSKTKLLVKNQDALTVFKKFKDLEEHLKQLKILYQKIDKNHITYKNGIWNGMTSVIESVAKVVMQGDPVVEPNPLYPDENFEQFVSRMIIEKKKKIERVLDLY